MSSDYLFVRPSLFRGFARTLDIYGSLDSYNWSGSPAEADARAMAIDWVIVGNEIAAAMNQFARQPMDRAGNEQLCLIEGNPIR